MIFSQVMLYVYSDEKLTYMLYGYGKQIFYLCSMVTVDIKTEHN